MDNHDKERPDAQAQVDKEAIRIADIVERNSRSIERIIAAAERQSSGERSN